MLQLELLVNYKSHDKEKSRTDHDQKGWPMVVKEVCVVDRTHQPHCLVICGPPEYLIFLYLFEYFGLRIFLLVFQIWEFVPLIWCIPNALVLIGMGRSKSITGLVVNVKLAITFWRVFFISILVEGFLFRFELYQLWVFCASLLFRGFKEFI